MRKALTREKSPASGGAGPLFFLLRKGMILVIILINVVI